MKGCVILMYKIAVLGEKSVVQGFAVLGLDVVNCQPGIETRRTLRSIASRGEYAVVYITESCYASLDEEELEKYENAFTPAVIPIPGPGDGAGAGYKRLNEMVIRAVGTKLD